jgi:hypothetical protein
MLLVSDVHASVRSREARRFTYRCRGVAQTQQIDAVRMPGVTYVGGRVDS